MNLFLRYGYVILSVFVVQNVVHASATTTHVKTLANLVTACSNVTFGTGEDFGGRMRNYLTTHFIPAANRLAACCTMATASFTGTSADCGVILGIENNITQNNITQSFSIMQGGKVIGQLKPGMNDVSLHLASLISVAGTTSHTADITFIPTSGSQTSKVRLRVLSGLQLSTYITNQQGGALLKNGSNALPGAGTLAATQDDQYLVVEAVALDASNPLPGPEQRIQVLNLSNITNVYTIMLEINNMGLISAASGSTTTDAVIEDSSLSSTYLASIKNVHILDELSKNTVPLLVLPRNIWQAGTSINKVYAIYIQSYANFIAGQGAGRAPGYYDLMINYVLEPYGYLKALHYFDTSSSLVAVVDQSCSLASGEVIGGMIGTDVYALSLNLSSDLSLVQVASNPEASTSQSSVSAFIFDPSYEHLLVGFDIPSMKAKSVKPVKAANALTATSTVGCPINTVSAAFFNLSYQNTQWQGNININWGLKGSPVYLSGQYKGGYTYLGGALIAGNPSQTPYTDVGSFPSSFWSLPSSDWKAGIKLVPVFYDVTTFRPLLSLKDLNDISTTNQAALYFYAYKAKTGEFLGALPVIDDNNNLLKQSTYAESIWLATSIATSYQASNYEANGVATPTMTGLVKSANIKIEYPGFGYIAFDYAKNSAFLVRNKFSDMSEIDLLVQQAWSLDNHDGSDKWMVSVPKAAVQAGVSVHVHRLAPNDYKVVLKDTNKNILGFKEFFTTQEVPSLQVSQISSDGKNAWFSTPLKMPGETSVVKIKESGNQLSVVKKLTAGPVATVQKPTAQTKQAALEKQTAARDKKAAHDKKAAAQLLAQQAAAAGSIVPA